MKQISIIAGIFLLVLFLGCNNQVGTPTQKDMIGTWSNPDGAMIKLNGDSSFEGVLLPAEYFTFYTSSKDVAGKRVNGTGIWKIVHGGGVKKINLDFKKMNDQNINGYYSVLIGGKSGILENKPSWYLFVWEEEEGGQRYKFEKKQ